MTSIYIVMSVIILNYNVKFAMTIIYEPSSATMLNYCGLSQKAIIYRKRPVRRYKLLDTKDSKLERFLCITRRRVRDDTNLPMPLILAIVHGVSVGTAITIASNCWCTDRLVEHVENGNIIICLKYYHGSPVKCLDCHEHSLKRL